LLKGRLRPPFFVTATGQFLKKSLRRNRRKRLLFVNKKKQKNFIDAGPWVLALTTPMAQRRQKFLRRFFKSGRFPYFL
jgi:hypothetical protein